MIGWAFAAPAFAEMAYVRAIDLRRPHVLAPDGRDIWPYPHRTLDVYAPDGRCLLDHQEYMYRTGVFAPDGRQIWQHRTWHALYHLEGRRWPYWWIYGEYDPTCFGSLRRYVPAAPYRRHVVFAPDGRDLQHEADVAWLLSNPVSKET